MATETNETAAVAAAKTAEEQTKTVAKAARAAAKTGTRRARKASKPARATKRKAATSRRTASATRTERTTEVNFQPTAFAGFGAFPAAAGFEKLVNETTGRSEEIAKRSRKTVEELSDIARENVEAVVEASRIAASGAQSIAQKAIAKSRDNVELAADTVRSMSEAKNPSDLLQLQAEFVRGAFDRFVSESSNFTESMVKLAGESFQPISTRATRNVERFNDIIA